MKRARQIMQALTAAGYEAYIVGGAVRDMVRGLEPHDIDIATNARPDQIRQAAEENGWFTVAVGEAFGVMIVQVDGQPFEVATFRGECYGADSHRPEEVWYCATLDEDLSRRDFTMNALAMDLAGRIIDRFDGMEDIRRRMIRAVGKPDLRFAEDGLRMFRAARFAAQTGFSLEADTQAAIGRNRERARGLSLERIRGELEKALLAPHPDLGLDSMLKTGLLDQSCRVKDRGVYEDVPILPELIHLDGLAQNPAYHHFDAWRHTLGTVRLVKPDLSLRWAALLHDVAKGWEGVRTVNRKGAWSDPGHEVKGAQLASAILTRLRLSDAQVRQISWLVRNHMQLPVEEYLVLRWLKQHARDFSGLASFRSAVESLLELHRADRLAGHVEPDLSTWETAAGHLGRILATMPFYPAELAISGGEIAAQLGSGPQVKSFQSDLLMRIQAGRLDHTREALLAALGARARRKTQE
nr:CCA tRNA nucleotidyltransferase [Acetonema longum]